MDFMEQIKILWPAATFLVLYTSLLFGGFSWMLKSQIKPIKELLDNHITDTNKKIDHLSGRIDKLGDRFDALSSRFDRLYEVLIKDKK